MIDLPNDLRLVKQRTADFMDGNLPSWLTVGGAGSHTVFDANTSGAFVQLQTGTAAIGDDSRLEFVNGMKLGDAWDVFRLRTRYLQPTTDSTLANVEAVSLADGTSFTTSNKLALKQVDDQILSRVAGASTKTPIMGCGANVEHTATLDWFHTRGVCRFYIDGMLAGELAAADLPDPATSYLPRVAIQTEDTSSDRLCNVYSFEVGFYEDLRER